MSNKDNNTRICSSYCAGASYDLQSIAKALQYIDHHYDGEIAYIKAKSEDASHTFDVVIFEYGCVIFWGTNKQEELAFLNKISQYAHEPLTELIYDQFTYNYGEDTDIDEENDNITLGSDASMLKISISYGLSQSAKLCMFESLVEDTIKRTQHVPKMLIDRGKTIFSKKELARKVGELFFVKNLINLHSVILDTPEFFWRKPKYEPYYIMALNFLDIETRIEIINKRLDVMHELYIMLSNEQQHRHSSKLELIIILLILIEIIIAILRDFSPH